MKFFKRFSVIALIACTLAGCGSSKSTTSQSETHLKDEPCQLLAHEKPDIRSWGEGIANNNLLASRKALADARGRMATNIAAIIKEISDVYTGDTQLGTASNSEGAASVEDNEGRSKVSIVSYAEAVVANTTEIKCDRYRRNDGHIRYVTCIEYRQGVEALTDKIVEGVYQQISKEQKQEMENNIEEWRKRIKNDLLNNN